MPERYSHIDFLRAVSIIGVIVVHILSVNLNSQIAWFFWNYLQFVVGAFILCSGYVLVAKYPDFGSTSILLQWYKKRLKRLLFPYYFYLVIHTTLILALPYYFSGIGFNFSSNFLFDSIFLLGGVNANWLVLLFVELTLLFPFLIRFPKFKTGFFIFSFLTALLFTFYQFPYAYYRYVMWVLWSLFLFVSMQLYKESWGKNYLFIILSSSMVFICLYFFFSVTGKALNLIDNKYPPNLYHLSYSLGFSIILLWLGTNSFLQKYRIKRVYEFISRQSYTLFFVHFIFLDFFLHLRVSLFIQFIGVMGGSLSGIFLYRRITNHIRRERIIR